jgi:hypothetical protein
MAPLDEVSLVGLLFEAFPMVAIVALLSALPLRTGTWLLAKVARPRVVLRHLEVQDDRSPIQSLLVSAPISIRSEPQSPLPDPESPAASVLLGPASPAGYTSWNDAAR